LNCGWKNVAVRDGAACKRQSKLGG
jgi:hypothetical protein